MKRIELLDTIGTFICFYFIYYALCAALEHRNPNASIMSLITGLAFALGCATVFLIHGIKFSKSRDKQAVAGAYLFSIMKINFPVVVKKYLPSGLIGVCLFFVLQDTCFDTLTIASNSLSPRIEKGRKVLVNNLAFGLRIPFCSKYLIKWSNPSKGDLIIFVLHEKYSVMCKEFVGFDGENVVVKDNQQTKSLRIKSILGKIVM